MKIKNPEEKLKELDGSVQFNYYPEKMKRHNKGKEEEVEVMCVQAIIKIKKIRPNGTPEGQEQIIYTDGISRCSPLDRFNLKFGRNIALGRALKKVN